MSAISDILHEFMSRLLGFLSTGLNRDINCPSTAKTFESESAKKYHGIVTPPNHDTVISMTLNDF